MTSQTNEQALEEAIEKALTGRIGRHDQPDARTIEETAEGSEFRSGKGFLIGDPNDFNASNAIDENRLWDFLETTQSEELEKLKRASNYRAKVEDRLFRMIRKYGVLYILRKGLDVEDAHFSFLYPLPLASSSQRVKDNFELNQFSVTRQVRYSVDNPREEIDMVIFLNGLPIITIELKNKWTGQNARYHGIRQYKEHRDPKQPLLQFGRCIVHMAVDPDEVYMTTKLAGSKTFFLPFNKGHNNGKGNPPNPFGHKSAYLWEEIFTRESLSNIIQSYVRFDGKLSDPLNSKTLFFPRYHQLDVVRKIVNHTASKGVGQKYLVQHSAGSGKSLSITWAAFRLIETYPSVPGLPGAKEMTRPLFDSVIVVTDRRLLDKQIKEDIKSFSQVKNIVAHAKSSQELKESLESGKKIIISTIQKFPFIVDGIQNLSEKTFAVIIDEAHSSQSGITAGKLNTVMGMEVEGEEEDVQDLILRAVKAKKMSQNASYLAFTATPKNATLERFGVAQEDGSFRPFHLYSMKQAIEEGFILDVVANYTTYKSYYEIAKSIDENPDFETKRAQKRLKAFVEKDKRTIATKSEVILEHFIPNVVNKKKLKGKAKGMVVTQSIKSAIRYYQALNRILKDKGEPFKILVAFSGSKTVDGVEYTEESINDYQTDLDTQKSSDPDYISDKLARYFNMDEYRLLVVANKYLTGFDQPKLCSMYIDKKLQGVLAVQALSRMNRSAPKLGKKTEDLFVLDFFNTVEEIKDAFDPFYTVTTLNEPTDVNVLHELKSSLDAPGIYEWYEVEKFIELYFLNADAQELSPFIDVSAERFNEQLELTDEEKADYKIKAKQFVKIYSQVSSLLPYEMVKWEMLFWFLKFLIPKLVVKSKEDELIDDILESVDLSTYGLERSRLSYKIGLDDSDSEVDPQNPNPRGAHGKSDEVDPLDEIIRTFNERYFSGWDVTPEEQRAKFIQIGKHVSDHPDFKDKVANNPDKQNSDIALKKIVDEVMQDLRKKELGLYRLYAQDDGFYRAFFDIIKRAVTTG